MARVDDDRPKAAGGRQIEERRRFLADFAAQIRDLPVPVLPQREASFADAELIVLSPGVPADLPALSEAGNHAPIVGDRLYCPQPPSGCPARLITPGTAAPGAP